MGKRPLDPNDAEKPSNTSVNDQKEAESAFSDYKKALDAGLNTPAFKERIRDGIRRRLKKSALDKDNDSGVGM
ncbi:MAG TPA: hypothetical protein VH592_13355 [Gemmataceae bacterium]|jgi:hypothetical protein